MIHTNYVYAFAFDPGQARNVSQPYQIIVVQHAAEDFTVVTGPHIAAADKGLWVTSARSYLDPDELHRVRPGLHRAGVRRQRPGHRTADTEDPDALYAPSHAVDIPTGCPAPPQHA